MTTLRDLLNEDRLGRIAPEAVDLPELLGPDGQPITGVTYVWRPSSVLARQLEEGFSFPMRCVVCPDGLRRFYPGSFEGQIASGFEGGLAVLSLIGNLSPEQRRSYRSQYLLFQRVRRTREHLGNSLLNPTSLRISRVGRDLAAERSLLPASVGQNGRGVGASWSVDRLVQEGRTAAVAAGVRQPDAEDCVRFGFLAAARQNPLHLRPEEVLPLVRMALYESIPLDEPLQPALLDLIVERTLLAMLPHLTDPAVAFDPWFSGPKNSFVRQVAKRKLLPGGVLDRDLVRRALLELGWQAYHYVADCLHALMRVFHNLLPAPLSTTEAAWFEQMHCKQPHFGNLPLVLLVERFPFFQEVLWEIWEKPGDAERIAVLHRLLSWYGEMASARRDLDRTIKQRRPNTPLAGDKSPLTVPLESFVPVANADETSSEEEENADQADEAGGRTASPNSASAELFAGLAERVRKSRQVNCGCALPEWVDRVEQQDEAAVTINHGCLSCGFTATTTLTLKEMKGLATAGLQK